MPMYEKVEDERGVRWARPTAAPRGADGPVLAHGVRRLPLEPIGCPDPFPLEWLERRPDWLEPKEGVRIVLDGPELGRAAGYIRLHGTCYQDGTGSCKIPPEVTYEQFYRGEAQVVDDEGHVREVAVGSIAIVDGHSDPRGTHRAAVQHLDKPEKMKLRGVLVEDEVGLLFLGCGRPDMTRAEAVMVNQSDTSGEWWPLHEMDASGKVGLVGNDLIGIALVATGAFRKSIPERFKVMAAALGRELEDEEVALMFDEMGAVPATAEPDEGLAAVEACPCGGHDVCSCETHHETVADVIPSDWRIALSDDDVELLTVDEPAVPILASPEGDQINELRALVDEQGHTIERLRSDMDMVLRQLVQMQAVELTEEDITLPDRVEQQEEVQRILEERIAALEQKTADAGAAPGAGDTMIGPSSEMVNDPVAMAVA